MAKLKVNDIKTTGTELFDDSESFMNELMDDEVGQVLAGQLLRPITDIIADKFCHLPYVDERPGLWTRCTWNPPTGPAIPVIL